MANKIKKFKADNLYVTSDLHFFHNNIIIYSNRPWLNSDGNPNAFKMTEGLIRNWNDVVPDDSDVVITGDLAMGGRARENDLCDVLSELNGRKYLVPGNHDTYVLDGRCRDFITILPHVFEAQVRDKDAYHGKQHIVFCHYSLRTWIKQGKGAWMCFGHSHGNLGEVDGLSMDVGVDTGIGYRPYSYFEIKEIMKNKVFVSVDHHGY